MLRNTRKLKRLLGDEGLAFLEHALDAPTRLLPHTEVGGWTVDWDRTVNSGATYVGSDRRALNLSLQLKLPDSQSTTRCALRAKLTRMTAPGAGRSIARTLDNRELDLCRRTLRRAADVLRGADAASTSDSLRAIRATFDEQIVAAHLKDFHGLQLDVAEVLSAMRELAGQSYENKSITFGCLLDRNRNDRPNRNGTFPQAILNQKKYRALTDGFRTAYRVSSPGRIIGFEDCTGTQSTKGRHYFPEWCEHLAAASHKDVCGLCLTRHGDILVLNAGTLRFTCRFGQWQYWNHTHIIDLLRSRARVQKVKPAAVGVVVDAIYRAALDVSFRRSGGLFVLLRSRKNLRKIVATGDAIGDKRRSHMDNTFDGALRYRTIQTMPRRVMVELAGLDGAVVLDNAGTIRAYGAVLRPEKSGTIRTAEGSRTKAAIGASNYGLSVKVSSDGDITFYENGRPFLKT